MKKILIVTNVCTLVLLYMSGFKSGSSTTAVSTSVIGDTIPKTTISSDFAFCSPCGKGNMANIQLNGLINYNQAIDMATRYKASMPDSTDARSVWFSLGTLKRFMWLIEKKSCTLCIDKSKLGLRIYYGRYSQGMADNHTTAAGNTYNYTNKHSVFMMPTYRKGNNNFDFNPNLKVGCNPAPLSNVPGADWLILSSNATMYTNGSTGNGSGDVIQNNGDLMPPPSGTDLCDFGMCMGGN